MKHVFLLLIVLVAAISAHAAFEGFTDKLQDSFVDKLAEKRAKDIFGNKLQQLRDPLHNVSLVANKRVQHKLIRHANNIELKVERHPIRKIRLKGVKDKQRTTLRIEEPNITFAQQSYSIDPTQITFTEGLVTVTAKGNTLLKCANWNYTTQRCKLQCSQLDDECTGWEHIMNITPGENYTLTLTPDDPGFIEVSIGSAAGEQSTSSTAFSNLTVATFNPNNDQWLLLGYGEVRGSTQAEDVRVRFARDGPPTLIGRQEWQPDTVQTGNPPGDTQSFFAANLVNFTTGTISTAVQFASESGAQTTSVRNARAIAIRVKDNDGIRSAPSGGGTTLITPGDTWVTSRTITFTPPTARPYLILAYAQIRPESTTDSVGARLLINNTEVARAFVEGEATTDEELFATHKIITPTAGVQQNISLQFFSEGGARATQRRPRIFAIPLNAVHTNESNPTSTTTLTSPQVNNVLTFNITQPEANEVFIIGSADIGPGDAFNGNFVQAQLELDGVVIGNMTIGGSDASDNNTFIAVGLVNVTPGQHTARITYNVIDDAGTHSGFIRNSRVTVIPQEVEPIDTTFVQRGVFEGTTNTFGNSISPVLTGESFVLFTPNSTSNAPNSWQLTPNLTETSLTFDRTGTAQISASWEVVNSPGLFVQRGTEAVANGIASVNVTVQPVDLDESFVIAYGRCDSGSGGNNNAGFFLGRFVSSTQVELRRGNEGDCAATVNWQVVQWNNAHVQSGSVTIPDSDDDANATIGLVNTTRSFLIFGSASVGTDPGMDTNRIQGRLANGTQVAFTHEPGTLLVNSQRDISYFVVETPGAIVQRNTVALGSDTDVSINSAGLTHSFHTTSGWNTGGGQSYSNSLFASFLLSDTTLRFDKSTGSQTQNIAWEVITIPQRNTRPVVQNVVLNATSASSTTEDNLTLTFDTSDADGDAIFNTTDWRINGTSIAVVNMPFESENGVERIRARDFSILGNNATIVNATFNESIGYDGRGAYDFDGTNVVQIPHSDSLNLGNALTIETQANIDTYTNFAPLIGKPTATSGDPFVIYALTLGSGTNEYGLRLTSGGADTFCSSAAGSAVTDEWTHVVGRWNGTHIQLFVNGTASGTPCAFSGPLDTNTEPVSFGFYERDYTFNFDGQIDGVRIYNRSLTDEQILALYENRTQTIVSQETITGESWQACVTPNDQLQDGDTVCSGNLTINDPNTPPTVFNASIVPTQPFVQAYTCLLVNVTDPDNITNVVAVVDRPFGSDELVVLQDNATCNSVPGDNVYSNVYHVLQDGTHTWTTINVTDGQGKTTTHTINLNFEGRIGIPGIGDVFTPNTLRNNNGLLLDISLINLSDNIRATQLTLPLLLTNMTFRWNIDYTTEKITQSNVTIEHGYSMGVPATDLNVTLRVFNATGGTWDIACQLTTSNPDFTESCSILSLARKADKYSNLRVRTFVENSNLLSQAQQRVDFVSLNVTAVNATIALNAIAEPQPYLINETVRLNVNVTDIENDDLVFVNITHPNGMVVVRNMTTQGGPVYNRNFNKHKGRGRYNVTYFVKDASGVNETILTSFFRRLPKDIIDFAGINDTLFEYNTTVLQNNSGMLDLRVDTGLPKFRNIHIRNHNENSPDGLIRFDDQDPLRELKSTAAFSIDPAQFNADNVTFTINATVTGPLFKCSDFNFTDQNCNGDFVEIANVTAGQLYNISVNSTDPAFLESSAAPDTAVASIDNVTFVVVFVDNSESDISFKILNLNGTVVNDTIDIDTSVDATSRVSVTMLNESHFGIGYVDGSINDLFYTVYDTQGAQTLSPVNLDTNIGTDADVAVSSMAGTLAMCTADDNDDDASYRVLNKFTGAVLAGESNVDGNIQPQLTLQNLIDCSAFNDTAFGYMRFDDNNANDATYSFVNEAGNELSPADVDVDNDVGETAQVAITGINGNASAVAWYDSTDDDISIGIRDFDNNEILAATDIDTDAGTESRVAMATVRENSTSTVDMFVVAWFDQADDIIEAAVYNADGSEFTAPFTIESNPNVTFPLLDVTGRDNIIGTSLCPGRFVVAYTNSSSEGNFKVFLVNGQESDGTCVELEFIPPEVFGVVPESSSEFSTGATIEIAANVTDNEAVQEVFANVSLPNGTFERVNLTNTLGDKYNGSFTIPSLEGFYPVTIVATDTSGNVNGSETTTFVVGQPDLAFVDVALAPINDTSFVQALIDSNENRIVVNAFDTDGSRRGSIFFPDTTMDNDSRISITPISEDLFVVGWIDGPSDDATFTILNMSGKTVFGATDVDTAIGTAADVSVADYGDRFIICYANDDDEDADFQIYSNAGALLTGETNIDANMNPTLALQNLVECSAVNSTYAAYSWFDDNSADASINFVTNAGTEVLGSDVDVDNNIGPTGQVAGASLNGNTTVVFFYDSDDDDVTFGIVDNTGSVVVGPTDVDTEVGTGSRVAVTASRLNSTETEDIFLISWFDQADDVIEFAAYDASGNTIQLPITIEENPSTTFPLIDLVGRDPISGQGVCPGHFVISYTNSSLDGVTQRLLFNGNGWNGVCVDVEFTPPSVINLIPTEGTQFLDNTETIEIAADVIDPSGVNTVLANITLPNGTINQITLSLTTGNKYNNSFTIPGVTGVYNVRIIANDTFSNVNDTETTSFIGGELNITFADSSISPINNDTYIEAFVDAGALRVGFNIVQGSASIAGNIIADAAADNTSRVSTAVINDSEFVIAWVDGTSDDVTYARYNFSGIQMMAPTDIDTTVGTDTDVSVTALGDRFVICYANDADNDADFQIFANDGTQLVAETNIDGNINPSLTLQNLIKCAAVDSSEWAYIHFDDQNQNDASYALVNSVGGIVVPQLDIDPEIGETGQVAGATLNNNVTVVAYYDSGDENISFAVLANDTIVAGPFDVDTDAGPDSRLAVSAIRENTTDTIDDFVIAWQDESAGNIQAAVYRADGTIITSPFVVASDPGIAFELIDVGARDPVSGRTLCPGRFIVSYNNVTNIGTEKKFHANGTAWEGRCAFITVVRPVQGENLLLNDTINLTINVSGQFATDNVTANLTFPNGTTIAIMLNETGNNVFTTNLSEMRLRGRYNVSFRIEDPVLGVASSADTFLNRVAFDVIDLIDFNGTFLNYSTTIASNASGNLLLGVNVSNQRVVAFNITSHHELSPFSILTLVDEELRNETPNFATYGIDSTFLNFSSANISVLAVGNATLFECTNFTLNDSDCIGDWVALQNITDNQVYSFSFGSEDTGYLETTSAQDVALTPLDFLTFVFGFVDSVTGDVGFVIANTNGTIVVNTTDVDGTADTDSRVAVDVINGSRFVVAWIDSPVDTVKFQIFDYNGTDTSTVTSAINVDTNVGLSTDISVTDFGDRFSVCYVNDGDNDADFAIFNNTNGATLVPETNVDGNVKPRAPLQNVIACTAVNSTQKSYVWFDNKGKRIRYRLVDEDGTLVTGQVQVTGNIKDGQVAATTLDDDNFVILWFDDKNSDINFEIFDLTGSTIAGPTTIDSAPGADSRVAVAPVRLNFTTTEDLFVATWFDDVANTIEASVIDGSGSTITPTFTVTDTPNINFPLIDVVGRDPIKNISICNGRFIVGFTNETETGQYLGFFVNGTTWDGTCPELAPQVTPNATLEGASYLLNETAIVQATVQSFSPLNSTEANITLPNGSIQVVPLVETGDNVFTANFTNLSQRGRYNITFIATDANNQTGTATSFFNRDSFDVVDMTDANGTFINYNVTILNNVSGILDLQINTNFTRFINITVQNHDSASALSILRIEDTDPGRTAEDFAFYALDPESLSADNLTITVNATADGGLFKCVDVNFTDLDCLGNLTQLQNITRDESYSVTFNTTDPAFLETSAVADVALAPINFTTFVIAFVDVGESDISVQVLNANGTVVTSTVDLDTTADVTSRVSVDIINDTHFVIAWIDGPSNDLSAAIVNIDGTIDLGPADLDTNVGTNADVSVQQFSDQQTVFCYANDNDNDADFQIRNTTNGAIIVPETSVDGGIAPGATLQNLIECAGNNATRWTYIWFDDAGAAGNDATASIQNETGGTVLGPSDVDTNIGETGQVATADLNNDQSVLLWYDSTDDDVTFAIANVAGGLAVTATDLDTDVGPVSRVSVATVRENETATEDMFVAMWSDANEILIEAAVVRSNGTIFSGPFNITTNPNTTALLHDVTGRDTIANQTLCPGRFIAAFSNASGVGEFLGFFVNGTSWDGRCEADLLPLNIEFSNPTPDELENITINATILNNGTLGVGPFTVQFFDGLCGVGTQINGNQSISFLGSGENTSVNVTYIASPVGPSNISVCADVGNSIPEFDETNNNLTVVLNVTAFQEYFGDLFGNVTLDTDANETEYNWNFTSSAGIIYFIDSDADIDFNQLVALGRRTDGTVAETDFSDADTVLNMSNFNDSIQNVFAINASEPTMTINLTLFEREVLFVPFVFSTNNTFFRTGILWDASDDTTGEFDTIEREDLVFIGNINPDQVGQFGTYDYEVTVPVLLREVNSTTNTLRFFVELR